jgi:hypothetical protein
MFVANLTEYKYCDMHQVIGPRLLIKVGKGIIVNGNI